MDPNGIMKCGHSKNDRDEIFTCITCYAAKELSHADLLAAAKLLVSAMARHPVSEADASLQILAADLRAAIATAEPTEAKS